jgi:hypothetical protein
MGGMPGMEGMDLEKVRASAHSFRSSFHLHHRNCADHEYSR